jgi:hypothetical protein
MCPLNRLKAVTLEAKEAWGKLTNHLEMFFVGDQEDAAAVRESLQATCRAVLTGMGTQAGVAENAAKEQQVSTGDGVGIPGPRPKVKGGRNRRKHRTPRGSARLKLIAALTQHHQYDKHSCLNLDPIGLNKLAKQAAVAASVASKFFKDTFEGYETYRDRLCQDVGELIAVLKLLNQDFTPRHLLGIDPPAEDDKDASDE